MPAPERAPKGALADLANLFGDPDDNLSLDDILGVSGSGARTGAKIPEHPRGEAPTEITDFPQGGYCPICGDPSYQTPSGDTCGEHGGLMPVDDPSESEAHQTKAAEQVGPVDGGLNLDALEESATLPADSRAEEAPSESPKWGQPKMPEPPETPVDLEALDQKPIDKVSEEMGSDVETTDIAAFLAAEPVEATKSGAPAQTVDLDEFL